VTGGEQEILARAKPELVPHQEEEVKKEERCRKAVDRFEAKTTELELRRAHEFSA
jgi:hypothetical protein